MCIHKIFFYQAEDGIRVRNVTGVQTCALPIWSAADPSPADLAHLTYSFDFDGDGVFETSGASPSAAHVFAQDGTFVVHRSEERRVGKECCVSCSLERANETRSLETSYIAVQVT